MCDELGMQGCVMCMKLTVVRSVSKNDSLELFCSSDHAIRCHPRISTFLLKNLNVVSSKISTNWPGSAGQLLCNLENAHHGARGTRRGASRSNMPFSRYCYCGGNCIHIGLAFLLSCRVRHFLRPFLGRLQLTAHRLSLH